jgi:hypothetical protein
MATTSNYGWTTPDDSSLVKDGASAIRALGTAIDTSMNTALGTKKSGLVLLNTTSFSGVASVSLTASTFTSTYDTYKIVFDLESVTGVNPNLSMRLRAAGTDASSANYQAGGFLSYKNASPASFNDNGTTSIALGQTNTASYTASIIDLINPFATKYTNYIINGTNADVTQIFGFSKSGTFDLTTSFDSASFIVSTGNFAGTYSVYGYNK